MHCSFGDFSARAYLWQINSFRGLRAHDIARVIGVDAALSDAAGARRLGRGQPARRGVAQLWRLPGGCPGPDDAPLLVRLLALTGRDPYA